MFLSIIFSSSCKKDSFQGLVGQWISVAYYRNDTGTFTWVPASMMRFPDQISFTGDSRFATFTDVSGVGGTYIYDKRAKQITLNVEADRIGNPAHSETLMVEKLSDDKLLVAQYYTSGALATKTEYSRIN